MSLFEVIGESFNPGPVGKVEFNDKDQKPEDKYILVKFIIAIIVTLGFEFLLYYNSLKLQAVLILNGVFFLYLILAYFINIRPDRKNTGWVPFLIDNPFRISDDINRFLILLEVFFMPGKFISKSIVGFFRES